MGNSTSDVLEAYYIKNRSWGQDPGLGKKLMYDAVDTRSDRRP